MKIYLPEGWAQFGEGIFETEDDEDMWQARRGSYTIDVGTCGKLFKCRMIRDMKWEHPADEVMLRSVGEVTGWIYKWVEKLR